VIEADNISTVNLLNMDSGAANFSLCRKILPGVCCAGKTSLACICGAASTFCQTQGPVSEAWASLPLSQTSQFLGKINVSWPAWEQRTFASCVLTGIPVFPECQIFKQNDD